MSIERAIKGTRLIIQGALSKDISLTSPDGQKIITKGLPTRHHFGVDYYSNQKINSLLSHCTLSLIDLKEQSYPFYKDSEISIVGHLVSFETAIGDLKNFIVGQCLPDETLGTIICYLKDYGS